MKKRQFLASSISMLLGTSAITTQRASAAVAASKQQTILTITGAIDRTNRSKVDDRLEQLMHKQGVNGDRAWAMTLADLEQLPQTEIRPTVEYDGKQHKLSGPLLSEVLKLPGIVRSKPSQILFHGIDGYSPEITIDEAVRLRYVLALRIDDQLLSIGGLGPIFALCDADHIAELARLPLDQRFAKCPWGLYCMELS
jgi:hypothetical protein